MIPERLRAIESELRKAVARHQYRGVTAHLEELRRTADEYLSELPPGHPLRLEIAHSMLDTIKWARLMVITERQALSNRLERLPRVTACNAGLYRHHAERPAPALCLDL